MANLLGQNIGTNYKGILNLNTLNGNLSATLQAVTDGDGNASPLQLSTTQVNVGGGTATGRLVVRGDGTNPIARFEESTGTRMFLINNAQLEFGSSAIYGSIAFPTSTALTPDINGLALAFRSQNTLAGTTDRFDFSFIGGNVANTAGTVSHFHLSRIFAAAAGSANFRPLNIAYTINNSGAQTGTATGIFLNATETNLNGMTHNLMDLQVGGVSRFRVSSSAAIVNFDVNGLQVANTIRCLDFQIGVSGSRIFNSSDGVLRITNNVSNDFGRLQFGGTTSAFPALKRNAAALEVRLADDSGFAAISASSFTIGGTSTSLASNTLNLAGFNVMFYSSRIYIDNDSRGVAINNNLAIGGGNVATNSSSVLECISTTKGFLPPRMTTAQRDLIATPAAGLVIYNTTTNVLNFHNGTAWAAV